MKTRLITLFVVLGLCSALFFVIKFRPAPVTPILVPIAQGLIVDIAEKNIKYEDLQEIGKERRLCILSGGKVLAVIESTVETYDKDWQGFLAFTERGMKAEGAQEIVMGEAEVLKKKKEAEVRRYDIRYNLKGIENKQIYYMVKAESDYYSVIVTLLDPAAYKAVRARTDKLMAAASISGEYRSQKKRMEQARELMRSEVEIQKRLETEKRLNAEQQKKLNQSTPVQRP
jgi:hypothetical protein